MIERPEGTPEEVPTEPEAAPESESATATPEAAAAATEELEAEAGAFQPETNDAEVDEAEVDEAEVELEADEAVPEELGEDDLEDEPVVLLGAEPAAAGTATGAAEPRRRGVQAPVTQRAPTQSELAVRVTDNASRFLVIGTVVVFVAILAFGLFAGNGGVLTTTPAPTAAPSVSAEPSASASAGASASAAPSGSVEVSASPS